MSGELHGARGHDHPAEAGRQSADKLRAEADYRARQETEAYDNRHAAQAAERQEASRLRVMFSPIGGRPLTPEAEQIARQAPARDLAALGVRPRHQRNPDRQGVDQQSPDQRGTNRQGTDQQGREGRGADRQGTDQRGTDRQGADRSLALRQQDGAGGRGRDVDRSLEGTPLSREDVSGIRETYRDYLKDITGARRPAGVPVVGEKPGRSPGDTSDLPPPGDKLAEGEDADASRAEKIARKSLKDAGDTVDATQNIATWFQDALDHPVPSGSHTGTPPPGPAYGTDVPGHSGLNAGSIAELAVVAGVLATRAGQWVHHKRTRDKGDNDAGN